MRVILLHDVPNVGKKYEVKNVSDGFARNFLFAKKLAEVATTQTIQNIETKKKQDEQKKEVDKNILGKNIAALDEVKISIKEKTNEKGHLFAAIHTKEIAKALKEQKQIEIPEEMIGLEKPIKEKGEYKIKVKNKEFILEIL
ncbi:MAG: 50S ribosomal protein L9 [Candidatus Paceibacterota bacterium]